MGWSGLASFRICKLMFLRSFYSHLALIIVQMNCWQRKRGTRTSVTSWTRPLPSWLGTEAEDPYPLPLSNPLLFTMQHSFHCTNNVGYKNCHRHRTQPLFTFATLLLTACFHLECVYEAMRWPNRQKNKIYYWFLYDACTLIFFFFN